jgi:CRP-like cAMP-binding protein
MLEILNRLEFFKQFSSYEKRKTIDMKTQFLVFRENEYLVKENSTENAFYIIVEGKVKVVKGEDEIELTTLKEGDFFGEFAFLTNTERTASIIANGLVIDFKIDKDLFEHLESETREKFKDYIIKRLAERMNDLNDLIIKSKQ